MSLYLQFSSLSASAAVDQQTGNLSVFDLLEEIRVAKLPFQLPGVVLSYALVKDEPSSFHGKVMVHWISPKDKQQILGGGDFHIPAEQRRVKALFRFAGLPIEDFGMHRFILSIMDKEGHKIEEGILELEVTEMSMDSHFSTSQDGLPN